MTIHRYKIGDVVKVRDGYARDTILQIVDRSYGSVKSLCENINPFTFESYPCIVVEFKTRISEGFFQREKVITLRVRENQVAGLNYKLASLRNTLYTGHTD